MAGENQQYLAAEVALWLQRSCGDSLEFLGCHNLTGVSVPRGDTNPLYCRTGKNTFEIQRTYRGTPGLGTATVVAPDTILNVLQELPCASNLFALHKASGSDEDPTNYDYLYQMIGVEVTSEDTDPHVVGVDPDDQNRVMISMPISFRSRLKVKGLTASEKSLSTLNTNDFNSVAFCDDPSCDAFGNLSTIGCQVGYIVTDGTTAEILKTVDGGTNFTEITSPFTDTDQNISKVVCASDVVIVLNGQSTAYAYSWDAGTNWSEITTPTKVLRDAVIVSGVKVWFVGDDGYVYYSSNRGGSVAVQDAGSATSQPLNAISAKDSLTLYAVGNANAVIKTTNGGTVWSALTGPATGATNQDLYTVHAVPGTDIVFVGDEEGNVYRSADGGSNWSTVFASATSTAGGIEKIVGCDCNVIAFIANDQDPYWYSGASVDGVLYQSVDGGSSWQSVEIPANDGLNDLVCCDVNRYWIVGEDGFTALVAGPSL